MDQRSPEWYAARLGKVGASRIADLMARNRSGYGASRANLMAELVCERLTGVNVEGYTNAAMAWGTEKEPDAKAAYSFMTDHAIEDVGFIDHPTILMSGCSPDGLIGTDGLIEAKCPNTATHLETLLSETIDGKYILQMQFQMAVTERAWCDFISFDPRLPAEMQLWIKRVPRDDAKIAEIEGEVRTFLAELNAKVEALQARYMRAEAA
jgi:putative phage-type endonuclease